MACGRGFAVAEFDNDRGPPVVLAHQGTIVTSAMDGLMALNGFGGLAWVVGARVVMVTGLVSAPVYQ